VELQHLIRPRGSDRLFMSGDVYTLRRAEGRWVADALVRHWVE
jgi:hypothetical protein